MQHPRKARKIVRCKFQPLHVLRRHLVGDDGEGLGRCELPCLGRTDAQDGAVAGIVLSYEVLRRPCVQHRTGNEETKGASHQDGIERLAGVMQFATAGPAKP